MAQPRSWHHSAVSITQLCRLDILGQTSLTFRWWRSSLFMSYMCWMTNHGTNMLKCQSGKWLEIQRSFQTCVWETLVLWVPVRHLSWLEESVFVHRKLHPINLFQQFEILKHVSQQQPEHYFSLLFVLCSVSTDHWEVLCLQGGGKILQPPSAPTTPK